MFPLRPSVASASYFGHRHIRLGKGDTPAYPSTGQFPERRTPGVCSRVEGIYERVSQEEAEQGHAAATDREAVARRLATAASQGRLGARELERRLARTHEASRYEELEGLLQDVPDMQEPLQRTVPEHTVPETMHITAALRDARRSGEWRVPPRIMASAGRGAVVLDFTGANVSDENITVDARPNLNHVELIVPEGYAISAEETVPGAEPVQERTSHQPRPDLPRLHVIANPGLGSIIVRHPRPPRRLRRILSRRAA